MNSLLTPEFFKKDKELTLEEKVNIMFDSWKSTLQPLFVGNDFYDTNIAHKIDFKYDQIFKNNWVKCKQICEMGGKDYITIIKNKDIIIKYLDIANSWYSYDIYSNNKYDKIGIWYHVYINTGLPHPETSYYFDLIKFSKDVIGVEKELYKKDDIILFDRYNKIVRITSEEEIKKIIKTKQKN